MSTNERSVDALEKVIYFVPAPDLKPQHIDEFVIPGHKTVPVRLPSVELNEKPCDYVKRLTEQIQTDRPILVGFCFGGVLALEIGKLISTEKIIIVSGIKSHSEISVGRKILGHLFLKTPLPVFENIGKGAQWVLKNILRSPTHIPRVWANGEKNKIVTRLALSLQAPSNAAVIHIHGERDRIFPIKTITNPHAIPMGGHFMYIDRKRDLISSVLKAVLK